MRLIYYEEEQNLNHSPWLWVLLLIFTLGALFPLVNGFYWQIIKGQPWGDKPMSDAGIIALVIAILLLSGFMGSIIVFMKLHVIIDMQGVHYQFFPNERKWNTITKDAILYYEIGKKNIFIRYGYYRYWFVRTKTMNVNGTVHLSLHLTNGRKVELGSRNPEGLQWAMKKLFSQHD